MKKTLLILGATMMAFGISAQGTWKITGGEGAIPVSTAIATGITGLTVMHNDASDPNATPTAKGVVGKSDTGAATVTYHDIDWNNEAIIQGSTNGMFYAMSPTANGTIDVSIKMGANKKTFVAATSDDIATVAAKTVDTTSDSNAPSKLTDPTYPQVYDTYNKTTGIWDNSAPLTPDGAGNQYVVMSFPVEAGKTYIVGCTGSKLMLRGINYVLGNPSSISTPGAAVKEVSSVLYFDVVGKKVSAEAKGLVIVKTTYADGTTDAQKLYKK